MAGLCPAPLRCFECWEVPPEISCMDQQELVALPAKHSDWLTPVEES